MIQRVFGSIGLASFLFANAVFADLIHDSARANNLRGVIYCLEEVRVDINAPDSEGWTPLHSADSTNSFAVAIALIERGADIHAKAYSGKTPLHLAARSTYGSEVVRLLLEKGSKVNAPDNRGWTPLHDAAFASSDAIGLLLQYGANVNAQAEDGNTPLHTAAHWRDNAGIERNDKAIKALIEAGADASLKNTDGYSARIIGGRRGPCIPLNRSDSVRDELPQHSSDKKGLFCIIL